MLRACCELAIDMAPDLPALAGWWRDHQPALRALSPADLRHVTARKDRRKQALATPRNPAGTLQEHARLI